MPNLQKQVLFSNGHKNTDKNWWTYSSNLTSNIYVIIFWQKLIDPITSKLILDLKKQIKLFKKDDLNTLKKIINLPIIIQNPNLSLCLISEKENRLNFFSKGQIKIKLIKKTKIISLPTANQGLKGRLFKEDKIIISNPQTLSLINLNNPIDSENLKNISKENSEPINYLIFSHKQKFKLNFPKIPKPNFSKLKIHFFQKTKNKNENNFISHISLRQKKPKVISKKRFYALILASSFLLLLGFSLGFGSYKKRKVLKQKIQQELIENITYNLEQAESLKNLNPSRAKTLLKEAKDTLDSYYQTNKNSNLDLEKLSQKVSESYAFVTHQYLIKNPNIFFDLSLIKKDFVPSAFSLSNFDLTLFDPVQKNLITIDIKNKSNQIIGGQDFIGKEEYLASNETWIFLATPNSLQIIDKETKDKIDSFRLEKININAFLGYSNNAYILDKNLGQVWRLRGSAKTLQKPDSFFASDQDLSQVNSFSLDGSLWFLLNDGGIEKYTSGIKDAFYPQYTFGLDEPLENPQKIYTDEYCQNLYVLDKNNNRILSFTKEGRYIGQYVWDGIKNIPDFVVSEQIGQILLILDDKIYGIEIQK